jgi:ABC-2 type transport system permease protein
MSCSGVATGSRPEVQSRAPRPLGRVNWLGVASLYRRELKRFLSEWRRTLGGAAVSALLFLAAFHLAQDPAPQPLPGVSLIAFLIPGLVVISIAQRSFEAAAFSILFDKLEGVIGDVLTPPLSAAERALAYALAAASAGLASGAAVVLVLAPFAAWLRVQPVPLALFLVMTALLHSLLGIAAGLWAERWEKLAATQTFGLAPLIYLSGAFFPTGDMPYWGRFAVKLNPAYYAVDGLRFSWLGQSEQAPLLGAGLLVLLNILLLILAWRLFAAGYKLKP